MKKFQKGQHTGFGPQIRDKMHKTIKDKISMYVLEEKERKMIRKRIACSVAFQLLFHLLFHLLSTVSTATRIPQQQDFHYHKNSTAI